MNLRLALKILCLVFSIHIFAAAESHVNEEDFKIFIEKIKKGEEITEILTFMEENSINSSSLSIKQRGEVFLTLVEGDRSDLLSEARFVFTDQNTDSLFYFPDIFARLNRLDLNQEDQELIKSYLRAFSKGFFLLFENCRIKVVFFAELLKKAMWLKRYFHLFASPYIPESRDRNFFEIIEAVYIIFPLEGRVSDSFFVELFGIHSVMNVPLSIERITFLLNLDRGHPTISRFSIDYLLHLAIGRGYIQFAEFLIISGYVSSAQNSHVEDDRAIVRSMVGLQNGINTIHPQYGTPLDLAQWFNRIAIIGLLLVKGAEHREDL